MSSQTVYCGNCGEAMAATSRFCSECGARQEAFAAAAADVAGDEHGAWIGGPEPGSPPRFGGGESRYKHGHPNAGQSAGHRWERLTPEAGELAQQLAAQLGTPGVALAGFAALGGVLACLVLGLAAALALPDESAIGQYGGGSDVVTEALRLAVASTMASIDVGGLSLRILPLLFLLAPIGGAAAAAYLKSPRLADRSARTQLAWGAAAALPFATAMLFLAVVAGGNVLGAEADFHVGAVLLYSLAWGAAGGVLGTWLGIRRRAPETMVGLLPTAAVAPMRAIVTLLKPLALLLALTALIGMVAVELQTLRGEQSARVAGAATLDPPVNVERAPLVAVVENALLVGDLAVATASLGTFAAFTESPLPVDDVHAGEVDDNFATSTGRLFAYRDAVPAYVFVPALLVLILLPLALALLAGFSTARRMDAPTLGIAVGWGALVGVVWALTLVGLRAVSTADEVVGGSLFASVLLVATVAGALGGFLAGPRPGSPPPAPPADSGERA